MKILPDLQYTESHEWVRWESDGSVTIGITDFAQQALGDLVFIDLPLVGSQVTVGQPCAVIESVKAASDVYAPLSGRVLAINENVKASPEGINADAFTAWLFRVRPDEGAASGDGRLMDAQHYAGHLAKEA
jgi:glycine cleavage system H protein